MSTLIPGPGLITPGFWESFGHSYFMTTVGTLYQTGRMDAIVRSALDIEHLSWRNRNVTGAQICVQGRSQGGYARFMQEVTKSTRTAPYAGNGGGAFICAGINDIGLSGNSSQMQTAFGHALRSCISRWRASSIKSDADASIAYGAGFTQATATQDFTSGSTLHRCTSTTTATITITIPADYTGQTIALMFIGAAGVFGGTGTFSGTASFATGTLSTSNIHPSSHCPVVRRFKGVTADAGKTLIYTATAVDASGEIDFNCWWIEADNPPPVVVCNIPRLLTAGYAGYATWTSSQAGADTDVANFNTILRGVVAEFDSMVQTADLDTAMGKNLSLPTGITTYYASDGVHPNEYGAARCADAIVAAVRQLSPPGGLGQQAYMQVDSPQSSAVRLPRLSGQWYLPEFASWSTLLTTSMAGQMWALPVIITEGRERWIQAQFEVTTAATNAWTARWGIYDDVGWTGYPQDLVVEFTSGGSLAVTAATGVKQSPTSGAGQVNQPLDPGLYWLAFKIDTLGATTAPTLRTLLGPNPYVPGWAAGGTALTNEAWLVTGLGAAALPTTFTPGGSAAVNAPAVGFKIF